MRLIILLFFISCSISAEKLNNVVALVGGVPITQVDYKEALSDFKKRRGVQVEKNRNVSSQVLDLLISRTIVKLSAEEESVIVSDKRVIEAIEDEIVKRGMKNKKQFSAAVKKSLGLSLEEYKEEMKRQLLTQQVMQIKVNVPPPSQNQIEEWYKNNKNKLGLEYRLRLILIPLKNKSTNEELRVNKLIEKARKAASSNFTAAAKRYSKHPSRSKGGKLAWTRLDELAAYDRVLAGAVQNSKPGSLSPVFVGEKGYYVLKVESRRPVKLDSVIPQIQTLLYAQNEQIAFVEWVKKERKRIAVDIRVPDYQEP